MFRFPIPYIGQQCARSSMCGGVLAGRRSELCQYGGDVVIDGFRRDAETCGDLLVAHVSAKQTQDIHFPGRQAQWVGPRLGSRSARESSDTFGGQVATDERGSRVGTELPQDG